jgi:hypothetical protein
VVKVEPGEAQLSDLHLPDRQYWRIVVGGEHGARLDGFLDGVATVINPWAALRWQRESWPYSPLHDREAIGDDFRRAIRFTFADVFLGSEHVANEERPQDETLFDPDALTRG